jgi:hypothetical protein
MHPTHRVALLGGEKATTEIDVATLKGTAAVNLAYYPLSTIAITVDRDPVVVVHAPAALMSDPNCPPF